MINIVIDTNLLKSGSTDFTTVQFVNKLNDIVGEIESNDLYDRVQILLPQIVVDELYEHQKKSYNDKFASIKSCKFPSFEIIPHEDYDKWLKEQFNVAIENLKSRDAKCLILDYPKNDILQNIIIRSIAKQPPFEGKEKESDKGFKDVIIWESVLEYKRTHITDTIIICSRDGRLCNDFLEDEYNKLFADKIYLLRLTDNSNRPIYDILSKLTDSKLRLTFAEKLKQGIISRLTNDFIMTLYIGRPLFFDDNSCYNCSNTNLNWVTIKDINDTPDERHRIQIRTAVSLDMFYIDENGAEKSVPKIFNMTIEYSFVDNQYYLTNYDLDSSSVMDISELDIILGEEVLNWIL